MPRAPKPSGGIEGFPEREKNGTIRPNRSPADQQIGEFVRFCPHFYSLPTAAVASASLSLNLCDIRSGRFDSSSVPTGFQGSQLHRAMFLVELLTQIDGKYRLTASRRRSHSHETQPLRLAVKRSR
jgi:hypothetical protein